MFSANENILLRQCKKRVVAWVEECISESVLELGVNVMVMQVSCKAPGCVPLETAIIIVFPKIAVTSNDTNDIAYKELISGLPESQGGSYKTKVLKPLNEITKQDVLEALPPSFQGGLRSLEKLCLQARDVMLAQITQLFGNEEDFVYDRLLMAQYLQECLQQYQQAGCVPPDWGEPFPSRKTSDINQRMMATIPDVSSSAIPSKEKSVSVSTSTHVASIVSSPEVLTTSAQFRGSGNFIIRRPIDEETVIKSVDHSPALNYVDTAVLSSTMLPVTKTSNTPTFASNKTISSVQSVSRLRQQQAVSSMLKDQSSETASSSILTRLAGREHAPGIRRPGCPCCNPDDPNFLLDKLMQL